MPKKRLTATERLREELMPTLHELYGELLTESVIDMVAKQCGYDLDSCIATMGDMVEEQQRQTMESLLQTSKSNVTHQHQSSSKQDNGGVKDFVSQLPSTMTGPSTASTTAAVASQQSAASGGLSSSSSSASPRPIPFLSPNPTLDPFKRQQLASVWAKNQSQSTTLTDAAPASAHPTTTAPHARSLAEIEAAYGSDANSDDEALAVAIGALEAPHTRRRRRSNDAAAPVTACPALAEPRSPVVHVKVPWDEHSTILDPEASSALRKQWGMEGEPVEVRDEAGQIIPIASPAHPHHHLHSLYLQLNSQGDDSANDRHRTSWQALTGSQAGHAPEVALSPNDTTNAAASLTPAEALAFQRKQQAQVRAQRKEYERWMKKHEKEKRAVKRTGMATGEIQEETDDPYANDEASALVASSDDAAATAAASIPDDIPTMPPLDSASRRASRERVRMHPEQLRSLLYDMFCTGKKPLLDPAIVDTVIESIVHSAPDTQQPGASAAGIDEDADDTRDLAEECCTTLLSIVQENEEQEASSYLSPSSATRAHHKGRKQHAQEEEEQEAFPALGGATVFAPGPRMSDAEIAHRMSIDPSFQPEDGVRMRGGAQNTGGSTWGKGRAGSAASDVMTSTRGNKRIIKLDRSNVNSWSAHTPSSLQRAPDLSSSWKLAALERTFPTIEAEIISESFAAHQFNLERTREYLMEVFGDGVAGVGGGTAKNGSSVAATTQVHVEPVVQPWSQKSQHHSKVSTTSTLDAERGIIRGSNVEPMDGSVSCSNAQAAALAELSDEMLERELGPLLDGTGSSSSYSGMFAASSSNPRLQASIRSQRRAAYFTAAMGAFSRGHGSLAAEMAAKGCEEHQALSRAHAEATLEIFRANNQSAPAIARGCIDLHGLHVAEAIHLLRFILARINRPRRHHAQSSMPVHALSIITGVGYHTSGGVSKAKLGPAVVEWLRKKGYRYSNSGEGEVKVYLR